jgi:toxin ParE1/3/4
VSKPLRFDVEAANELEQAAAYYEERREGLGNRFLTAAREVLARVRKLPGSGAPVPRVPIDLCVRRIHLHRFPYAIAYVELPTEIRVLAVSHGRRRPGYWAERLPLREVTPPAESHRRQI